MQPIADQLLLNNNGSAQNQFSVMEQQSEESRGKIWKLCVAASQVLQLKTAGLPLPRKTLAEMKGSSVTEFSRFVGSGRMERFT